MKAKIDVIVPIYNMEQYLSQCLESLANQSLCDIRIICINDGSTDCSLDIMQQYARTDNRFYIIDQANKGYGASVNIGLDKSQAEYVGVIEPDDFVDPFNFETLYRLATGADVDIAKCAYNELFDLSDGTHSIVASSSSQLESHLAPFEIDQYPDLLMYHPSIWSCIYRHDFLTANQIRFIEAPGAGWTDNPFFISTMCHAKKIIWSNERHYYYRRSNPNASSNLKDCSIPLLRALDMLKILETESLKNPVVQRAIFKRCLMYILLVTENQYFVPSIHIPLIRKVVLHIPSDAVQTDFFTAQEKVIHRIFANTEEV